MAEEDGREGTVTGGRKGVWASVREAIHGSEEDFTEGSLNRAVGLLAVPMVLEMAGESLFAVVDAFFVARLGSEALAAVGLTESVLEIIYAIAVGLAMATTAVVARRFGEGDKRAAAKTAVQAIYIGVAMSVVFGTIGAIWAPDILRLMGADEATVSAGTSYTRLLYASMISIMLLFIIGNAMIFAHVLTTERIPHAIATTITDFGLPVWGFLIVVNILDNSAKRRLCPWSWSAVDGSNRGLKRTDPGKMGTRFNDKIHFS